MCKYEHTEAGFYFDIKNSFSYDSKNEGYWMFAFLNYTQLLFIVNKEDFTEKMLNILVSFYRDYPYICFRQIKLLGLLETASKDIVENVLSDKENAKNLGIVKLLYLMYYSI